MVPIHRDPCYDASNGNGTGKKRAACRYYQTSSCRRGSNCPFAHVSIAGQAQTYTSEHMYPYHPLGPAPVYGLPDSRAYPVFLWQPYTPLSPSFDTRYGFARRAETFADYPDDKSDPSSVESSSTVASMDHRLRVAHDSAWQLGQVESKGIQYTASSSEDAQVNSSPGCAVYGHPVYPAVSAKHAVGRSHATSERFQGSMATLPSLPSRDGLGKKPLAYKTKPCKFYAANGKCVSGEKCTFIHDAEPNGHAESSRQKLALPTDAKLPPKPLNKFDECRARDFYPITWRVIGGGVMMGGQRQICPAFAAGHCNSGVDCKLAHETELETDPVGFVESKNEYVLRSDRPPRQPNKSAKRTSASSQRPKSIKVPLPEPPQRASSPSSTPLPERSDGDAVENTQVGRKQGSEGEVPSARDTLASPVHRRTRSMSMVLTSPSPLDTTQSCYAAEL